MNDLLEADHLPQEPEERDETLANVEIAVLTIVFILAILGNVFILYALLQQRKLRPWSRVYFLMAQLSIADLLVAFFNVLPQLMWDITFRFKGGDYLCRIIKFMQVFVLYLSTYVLVAMSVDRYCAVIKSNTFWKSQILTRVLVILAWVFSILLSLPQVFIFSYQLVRQDTFDCWATFSGFWNQKAYVAWFVVSVFVIPLIVILFCYGAICNKIFRYNPRFGSQYSARYSVNHHNNVNTLTTLVPGNSTVTVSPKPGVARVTRDDNERRGRISDTSNLESVTVSRSDNGHVANLVSEAKLKTIKLTTVIVACFIICWAPFCVSQMYLTFYHPEESEVGPIHTIFLLLASLNSCCNPWIYLAFSESLMDHLKNLLRRIPFLRRLLQRNSEGVPDVAIQFPPRERQEDGRIRPLIVARNNSVGDEDENDEAHLMARDIRQESCRDNEQQMRRAVVGPKQIIQSDMNELPRMPESAGNDHRPSDPLLTLSTKLTGL